MAVPDKTRALITEMMYPGDCVFDWGDETFIVARMLL
jgi:hypothetical protein